MPKVHKLPNKLGAKGELPNVANNPAVDGLKCMMMALCQEKTDKIID